MAEQEESLRTELAKVQYQNLVIQDQQSYDYAASVLIEIKTWRKRWEEYWQEPKDNAYKAWKGIVAKFNEADETAAKSEAIVKQKILAWDQEQEHIRQEAQRKAEAEAKAKEEAERQARAAEMEMLEVDDADIEAVLSAPSTAVAEVVQPTYQKVSSISTRANWCAEVTDLKALFKALGSGKFKLNPDQTTKTKEFFESLLKPQATANTSTLNIPGVVAVNRPSVGVRGK